MKRFFTILFAVMLVGCDSMTLAAPKEKAPPEMLMLPNDADFLSFSGERYEKYYFHVDPAILNRQHTLSGSSSGISLALPPLPLRALVEPGSFSVLLSGSAGFSYAYSYTIGTGQGTQGYTGTGTVSKGFSGTVTLSDLASPLYEEYDVLKPFDNASLVLPKTESYSNGYNEYKYHTYFCTIPAELYSPLIPAPPSPSDISPPNNGFNVTNIHAVYSLTSVPLSLSNTFDRYILASRGFYQYKKFTIRYQPDLVIHGFRLTPMPHPVVKTLEHNEEENTITAVFYDYNEPYTGPLFAYWIEAEDGTWREKTISIE